MNTERAEIVRLLRLAAARRLEAEVALRDALATLEQSGVACRVASRPDLENFTRTERRGADAVLQVAGIARGRAAAALERAGWRPVRAWYVRVFAARQPLSLVRGGIVLELAQGATSSNRSDAREYEPGWAVRIQALRDTLRGGWPSFLFMDLPLKVHAGVFKPGAASANAVQAVWWEVEGEADPIIIDVGTGTGAIALAIAAGRADAQLLGIDISRAAVRNARRNARHLRIGNARFEMGELLSPVPAGWRGQVNVIVANLPWIPGAICAHAEMTGVAWRGPEWSVHGEGMDGLDLQRRLARAAWPVLRPAGALVLEIDEWQAALLLPELKACGYDAREDLPGLVVARKEARAAGEPTGQGCL
jgi:release factor glutamine methyltransferase